jgi:hypothetical protein
MKKITGVLASIFLVLVLVLYSVPAYAGDPSPTTPAQLTETLKNLIDLEENLIDQGELNEALLIAKQIETLSQQLQSAIKNQPIITVTSPNGGEILTKGSVKKITWASNNIDKVSIMLMDNYGTGDWIATNIPNTKSYNWTVSTWNTINTQFKIKIIGYRTGVGSVTDISDNYFSIVAKTTPAITLLSPNGNEIWQAGKTYDIKWKYSGPNNNVVYIELISMATEQGEVYPIADRVFARTGKYSWKIPSNIPYGTRYKISIGATGEGKPPSWGDRSDNYFAIENTGKLTITLDPATPKSTQVIAGTAGVEFTKIKLAADQIERQSVRQIQIAADWTGLPHPSMITNVSLWDRSTQVGSTIAAMNAQGKALFDLAAEPLIIPAGGAKTLTIKADVNTIPYAVSGGIISLGIQENGISSVGLSSGQLGTGPQAAINGNPMYTYKTKLSFVINSSTPNGTAYAGANKTLIFFNVTNQGSYAGYLHSVVFTMNHIPSTGGRSTAQTDRVFYLYDTADLTTFITTASFTTGRAYNNSTITMEINKVGYEIPAGQTKTFALVGDTTDMGTGTAGSATYLQFYINDGTKVNWTDGFSSVSSLYTRAFPIYGGNLVYSH